VKRSVGNFLDKIKSKDMKITKSRDQDDRGQKDAKIKSRDQADHGRKDAKNKGRDSPPDHGQAPNDETCGTKDALELFSDSEKSLPDTQCNSPVKPKCHRKKQTLQEAHEEIEKLKKKLREKVRVQVVSSLYM
jgi:hypothetical protein